MKESIGYTVTINIVIVFIIVLFAFFSATLVYFKSNKVSNVITDAIERYEGYNDSAQKEIKKQLSAIGYNVRNITCGSVGTCTSLETGDKGYCVYLCTETSADGNYYYYRIKTNMAINIPIINNMVNIPIFSNTNRMYDFEH